MRVQTGLAGGHPKSETLFQIGKHVPEDCVYDSKCGWFNPYGTCELNSSESIRK